MSDSGWDDIVNFGDGEETVNFGPRLEAGSALYQVETSATISHRGETKTLPQVYGITTDNISSIAAGSHLSVFTDTCRKFMVTHAFEADIDAVAITDNGHILAVGDATGTLHFFDGQTQMRLFSKVLVKIEDEVKDKVFQHLCFTPVNEATGVCELIVATSKEFHILENLQVAALKQALQSRDLAKAKELQQQIHHVVTDVSAVHTDGMMFAVSGTLAGQIVTSGAGTNCLGVWERMDKEYVDIKTLDSSVLQGAAVQKCALTSCGNLMYTLDSKGVLRLVNLHLLVVVQQWEEATVKDFSLLESGDSNKLRDMKMVLLLGTNDGNTKLEICCLPTLESVYSLVLSFCTFLIHSMVSQEMIYVIEGVAKEGNNEDEISTLRIRCLTEAMPETRLQRLLNKRQYEAAEKFAKQYDQNIELVHKARANHLFEQLSPWNVDRLDQGSVDEKIQQLRSCLLLIEDDVFVARSCTKAALPTFQATFDLLKFTKDRLEKKVLEAKSQGTGQSDTSDLLTKTLEMLYRLGTYNQAFGMDSFSGESWDMFLRANMLREVLCHLREGDIQTAVILWNRHQSEFAKDFKASVLQDLLAMIPDQTRSRDLRHWLTDSLIPCVIRRCPTGLPIMASWIEQRARNMEIYEKEAWPSNSLEFCELLQNTCVSVSHYKNELGLATPEEFSTQISNFPIGYYQIENKGGSRKSSDGETESSMHDAFHSLNVLIYQLKELLALHTKYNCRLSLAEYVQETVASLTYRMLDRVAAVELIPAAIEKFVRPYMREHRLSEDKMLFQYIGDLAKRSGSAVTSTVGQKRWEAKAIAVIDCIEDPDYKLQGIHNAMKRAYVPWSPEMEALVQGGLSLKHPRVSELEELYRLTELHKMLIQYDLRNYNFRDATNPERLVYYILTQDRPTAMDDALRVVSTYDQLANTDAYTFRFNMLIADDRLDEALTLLKTLPTSEALHCCLWVVQKAIVASNNTFIFGDEGEESQRREKALLTDAACHFIKELLRRELDFLEKGDLQQNLGDLSGLSILQTEFGEFISHKDYLRDSCRKSLLERHLDRYLTNKVGKSSTVDEDSEKCLGYPTLLRLASVLKFCKTYVFTQLGLKAAQSGYIHMAVEMAKELYADLPSVAVAKSLFQIAHGLCRHLAGRADAQTDKLEMSVHEDIQEIARTALVECSEDMVCDCLALCKSLSQVRDVLSNCESGDYGITVKVLDDGTELSSKDPYTEWTFDSFYDEEGLVMNSGIATPLVYKHCMANMPSAEDTLMPYTQNRVQGLARKPPKEDTSPEAKVSSPTQTLRETTRNVVEFLIQNGYTEKALGLCLDTLAAVVQYFIAQNMGLPIKKADNEAFLAEAKAMNDERKAWLARINEMVISVLNGVLTRSKIDHELALGYLCDLPKKRAFEMLKKLTLNAGHHYKKTLVLARLGIDLAVLTKEPKIKILWSDYAVNSEWGLKLTKLKVPFKDLFKENQIEKRKLLPSLVSCKNVNISIIKEFCSDYNLVAEDAILLFLKKLLLPNPKRNFNTAECSDKTTLAAVEQSLQKAKMAIKEIDNKALIPKTLQDIYEKVDVYAYERLTFILENLRTYSPSPEVDKGIQLIEKLKVYKRVAPPGEYEIGYRPITEDEEVMYGSHQLSPLSKERLPFQPLLDGKPWKIISPELNADTVDVLWPVANILKLGSDAFYLSAIKNILADHIAKKKQTGGATVASAADAGNVDKSRCSWTLDKDTEEKFFPTLRRLLMKLMSCENAVACCNFIMKELPMGAEKVVALQACVDFTEKWACACSENQAEEKEKALSMHNKFYSWLRRLSVEQVLFQNNVGEPELLAMSGSPVKLIFKLYEHDSILERQNLGAVSKTLPDIHKITDDVARICEINIEQIRVTLMEKWLPSTQQPDADMTFNLTSMTLDSTIMGEEDVTTQDEVHLQRAIYLIQNKTNGPLFLLNYIYKQDSANITNMCRVRALRCLFSVLDIKAVNKIIKTRSDSPMQLDELLKNLVYMVRLENLHLPQTLNGFTQCNKEGLVRGIWRKHSHDKQAVRLISDLCLDYHIHDVQLWNSVLQQLMAFQMTDYLRHVLSRLSYDPELWKVPAYHKMWAKVVSMTLNTIVLPMTEKQREECLDAYKFLHGCPQVLALDLVAFARQFAALELCACGLGCLLLVVDDKLRETELATILQGQGHLSKVKIQLEKWAAAGKILPMMQQVEHLVYKHINGSHSSTTDDLTAER